MFSLLRARSLVLIVLIGVGWGLEARADKVDWSQYVEPAGYKVPAKQVERPAKPAPAASPTRPPKQATKKQRNSVAQRARAKPKH
jgi:hypothetical protein